MQVFNSFQEVYNAFTPAYQRSELSTNLTELDAHTAQYVNELEQLFSTYDVSRSAAQDAYDEQSHNDIQGTAFDRAAERSQRRNADIQQVQEEIKHRIKNELGAMQTVIRAEFDKIRAIAADDKGSAYNGRVLRPSAQAMSRLLQEDAKLARRFASPLLKDIAYTPIQIPPDLQYLSPSSIREEFVAKKAAANPSVTETKAPDKALTPYEQALKSGEIEPDLYPDDFQEKKSRRRRK